MDDRVVVYEREGERETEAETEIGKQKGRTIRKREESPGAFQRGVGMRQGSHRQTCLPILVPCGSSRKSKKLRRGSPGSSARENQAASLIWIRMYREYVLISLWMHNHIHVIVRIYVKHWIMFMTYAHNYTTVKVVSNYMGPHVGDCSLLSGPLPSPILLFRMFIPCYLSSHTCLAPASFTHPQVSIYTPPPLESPPYLYLGGLACPKALMSLTGLTWLLLILSRKTLSSSRIKNYALFKSVSPVPGTQWVLKYSC